MSTPKRSTPFTITRRYAPDPARQVQALLRLLVQTPKNSDAPESASSGASTNCEPHAMDQAATTASLYPSRDER